MVELNDANDSMSQNKLFRHNTKRELNCQIRSHMAYIIWLRKQPSNYISNMHVHMAESPPSSKWSQQFSVVYHSDSFVLAPS